MDFGLARAQMIESQLRPNDVNDERLIAAMAWIPRELFVPPARRSLAYMDEHIEIAAASKTGGPRYLISPMTLGRLVQLLHLKTDHAVLDVGCGTGYSTAILASIVESVVGVESDAALAEEASANLGKLGLANARVATGELSEGHLIGSPYNAICIAGRVPREPLQLLAQLKEHGRLAVVLGDEQVSNIAVFTRNGAFGMRYAFSASAPELPGFDAARPPFRF
jgi:protein-L-isoaspartate(D-aspartate) O-methyltransferase